MSNDISRDPRRDYIDYAEHLREASSRVDGRISKNQNSSDDISKPAEVNETNPDHAFAMENSLEYMGNINRAKLDSLRERTKRSIETFENDFELANDIMAYEDELIERGYSQADAFRRAELFYKILKDKRTYHN